MSILIVVVKFLIALTLCNAMTMKQVRSTGKMMRKSCQPKNNVADEKIDPIPQGTFIEEKEVMCYVACIMKMANTIKNNKLNYEAAMKQADLLLPDEIREPTKEAMTACRNVENPRPNTAEELHVARPLGDAGAEFQYSLKIADSYKDICEASFFVTKCMYNHNPATFFFP